MDISAPICISHDSLKQVLPAVVRNDTDEWYEQTEQTPITLHNEEISIKSGPPAVYADANRYAILQRVKDAFDAEGFIQARDAMNPFETIGRSIFINRAAVKLANIDAVHNVTGEVFTFDHKTSDKEFTFCDIAAGPGGFTQYMQYRFPMARGYGMTLKHEKLDWSTRFLDMKRFIPFYGPDKTGNLYTNWGHFIRFVLEQQPQGVDLVTADGGFDLEDNRDKTLLHRQEFLSSRLLLTQAVVGVACTKLGGNFIVKVFDTVTVNSAQILFILAQCFQKIMIFKPITSRPANAERYVLCMGRKPEVQAYYQLLAGAARAYTDNIYLNRIMVEVPSPQFSQWLIQNNNLSTDRQLQAAQNILLYLKGQPPQVTSYDIPKFLTIWNLPDTPPNPKQSIIKIY